MIQKKCLYCNNEFQVSNYRRDSASFCSTKCYNLHRAKQAYYKICPICKVKFINSRKTRNKKYCSQKCQTKARRKYDYKDKICSFCGKKFKFNPKNPNQEFCNNICNTKNRAYQVNENFFKKIDSEGKAYLLGAFFSDGNIAKNKNYISISSNDKDLIKTFKKLIKTNHPIYCYKKSFSLILCNKTLKESLIKLGLMPAKSYHELSIPNLSKKLIRHFIRGVYDGDGSYYLSSHENKYTYLYASLSCNSLNFSNQIKKLLEKELNINFHKVRLDKKPMQHQCYQLRLSRQQDVKKFINYLYKDSNYCLKRKYDLIKKFYGKI